MKPRFPIGKGLEAYGFSDQWYVADKYGDVLYQITREQLDCVERFLKAHPDRQDDLYMVCMPDFDGHMHPDTLRLQVEIFGREL